MQKVRNQIDRDAAARPRRRPWTAFVLLAGLAVAPMIYEGAVLCTASWRSMLGLSAHVETPLLDAMTSGVQDGCHWARTQLNAFFSHLPWEPWMVIVLGLAVAVFSSIPLRRA